MIRYRGAEIERDYYHGYTWLFPDLYDVDGYGTDNATVYAAGRGNDIEDCKEAIDEFIETEGPKHGLK